jgi:hypothetical protein
MAKAASKSVPLYLTDWQIRMIKDVCGVECHIWEVEFGGPVVRYAVYPPQNPKAKRMYLTDWQMQAIRDEVGVSCHFIEILKGDLVKYRVPVLKEAPMKI